GRRLSVLPGRREGLGTTRADRWSGPGAIQFPCLEIVHNSATTVSPARVGRNTFGSARNHFPVLVQTSRNRHSLTIHPVETPQGGGGTGECHAERRCHQCRS